MYDNTVARNGHPASFFYTPRLHVRTSTIGPMSTCARGVSRSHVDMVDAYERQTLRSHVKLHVRTWSFTWERRV